MKARYRNVAMVTSDFRAYHRVVPFLESHGIKVLAIAPDDPVPASVQVLIGGPEGDVRSLPAEPDLERLLLAILARLDPRPRPVGYDVVVIGVDPGKSIGLAILADGQALLVATDQNVDHAVTRVAKWVDAVPAKQLRIHVGSGAPAVGRHLVQALQMAVPTAVVATVSEAGTTPWRPVTGSRHTDAAIHIAMRKP